MKIYLFSFLLLALGLFAVFSKKNLIKIILGLIIINYAISLLLVLFRAEYMSLTASLIGVATTLILSAVAKRIYDRYGTFDVAKIRKLKG